MSVNQPAVALAHGIPQASKTIARLIQSAGEIVVGKHAEIKLSVTCLLAGGHFLIEDLPGVGKTTLAHLLARLMGLEFQRIQFTSDLLPADITGVYVYDRDSAEFRFHPGPIFTHVVLADEINRATPRAQSALLEAMAENQVTIENHTHDLKQPFFVIATQNPVEQAGTFPLPESQLDRFLMCLTLGYPDRAAERKLYAGDDRRLMLHEVQPLLDGATLLAYRDLVNQVHLADPLLDYVQDLVDYSRQANMFICGLSPRAGLGLIRAARAYALVEGRDHAVPDDIQAVLPAVVRHRLGAEGAAAGQQNDSAASALLAAVPIP